MAESSTPVQQSQRAGRTQAINFITDFVTLLVALAMIATGLLLKYVLPPGSRGGQGLQLWELNRHELGDVHFWLAVAMAALFILHVALHWAWVCNFVSRRVRVGGAPSAATSRRRAAYGVSFLLLLAVLVGGFVWIANGNIVRTRDMDEGVGRRFRGGRGTADTQREVRPRGAPDLTDVR